MREMSTDEAFAQIVVKQNQHESYIEMMTSTLPNVEYDAAGEMIIVFAIRYTASFAPINNFRLR